MIINKCRKKSIIGSGTGRKVYDHKQGQVIKKAVNKAGCEQNKVELSIIGFNDICAKTYKAKSNYRQIFQEKLLVENKKGEIIEKILGFDYNTLVCYFDFKYCTKFGCDSVLYDKDKLIKKYKKISENIVKKLEKNIKVQRILELVFTHQLLPTDLLRDESWEGDMMALLCYVIMVLIMILLIIFTLWSIFSNLKMI